MMIASQTVVVIVKIAKLLTGQLNVCSANKIHLGLLGVQTQQNFASIALIDVQVALLGVRRLQIK